MAENPEETPENIVEEVEAAATPDEGTPEAEATESTETETEAAEPEATPTRKERNAAARAKKAAKPAAPRTLEERIAEREARRERTAANRRRYRAKAKAKRAAARADAPAAEPIVHEHGPGKPKVRQGIVVSDKADKTIVVRIDTARRHQRYQKILRTSTTLHAHDETNDAHAGDTVRVMECRPLSRTKRWRLIEITERAR
jgi:small subunit ribosomal protein S17